MKVVIDAEGGVLGRVAAYAAKQALQGKEVVVVNSNKALITGEKLDILGKYKKARARGGLSQAGPYFPKTPERIMKRTIRGMLPPRQFRGDSAYDRVMCYNKTPTEFEHVKKISLKKEIKYKAMELSQLSREL